MDAFSGLDLHMIIMEASGYRGRGSPRGDRVELGSREMRVLIFLLEEGGRAPRHFPRILSWCCNSHCLLLWYMKTRNAKVSKV